jgi:ABC-2 type transport system permease protein
MKTTPPDRSLRSRSVGDPGKADALVGAPRLLRLALRRDRVLLPVWVAALVLSSVSSVQATVDLYPDAASRTEAAAGINDNPALVAIYGPLADVTSVGSLATFKLLLLGGVFVAMLCSVLVRRHTRLEEESGRAELLASTVVGRHALLAAAVTEAVLAAAVTGLLTALGNTAAGLDAGGSLAFGLAWTGLGLAGAGVTALCCQLTASARTAGGLVALVLGAGYVLRAVGDLSAGWVSWLSPFGWATQLRAYGDERWWVLALPVLLAVGTLAGAVALADRRDVGAGLLPDRPGPARGTMGSVTALTLRLHRGSAVAWGLGILALGAVMGGIAPGVADLAGSAEVQDMLRRTGGAGALVDAFLATEISFLAVGVTAFAVAAVVRASGEETEGRTESVLATATSRSAVLGAVALVALAGPVVLMLGFGLGASLTYGAQQDGVAAALGDLLPAALAPLPAVWVVSGVGLLLFGLRARWATLGWAVLAACLLLGQVGELLGLPGWVVGLSPYGHLPRLPAESFAFRPELGLTAIAAALLALAVWRYRERDVG